MIVMPSNCVGFDCGYIAGNYPGRLAHLYSPNGWMIPKQTVRYALDNGRFSQDWSEATYLKMLKKASFHREQPMWALVPDVVGDRDATLREWDVWSPRLREMGFDTLAFAAQDGMSTKDVPSEAALVFIGGTTKWKWGSLGMWTEHFPRVHVGRVNTEKRLWEAHEAGAESVDGTGYFRGDPKQLAGLLSYLQRSSDGLDNPRGRKLWM
jgi:hypothetical protein